MTVPNSSSPPVRWNRIVPWVLIAAVFVGLLFLLSDILMPFLLGTAVAYLCNPLVTHLHNKGVGRAWGALLVTILLALICTLFVLLIVPLVWREGQLLGARLPQALDAIQDHVLPWLSARLGMAIQLDADTLREWIASHWTNAGTLVGAIMSGAGSKGSAALGWLINVLLAPVVAFYLLLDWPRLIRWIDRMIPRPWHAKATRLFSEMDKVLSEFVRGQLLVMVILAIYYSLGLWIAGVNFPLPVGMITGFLVFIPYVGYGLGLTLATVVAILQFEGWPPIIGMAIVYALGQAVESTFLTPRLVGERIGLHPLAVIFFLMAFGSLFGFTGVLVALPVCAAGAVAYRELRAEYYRSPLYLGDGQAIVSDLNSHETTDS